jgi:hypothetical protein
VSTFLGFLLLVALSHAGVVLVNLPGVLAGSRESARVLAVTGFAIIATLFLAYSGDGSSAFQGLLGIGAERLKVLAGPFLIAAGVALLVSRPAQRALTADADPVQSWLRTARAACWLTAFSLAGSAAARLLLLIDGSTAELWVQFALTLVAAAAAVVAIAMLRGDAEAVRLPVVGILGGTVLLGIVAVSVAHSGDAASFGFVVPAEVVGWWAMPALALWSLLVAEPVRTSFKPIGGNPTA